MLHRATFSRPWPPSNAMIESNRRKSEGQQKSTGQPWIRSGHDGGDAQLRALLIDCLTLWDVRGRVAVTDDGATISTDDGIYLLQRASTDMGPARWFLQTPARRATNRPSRAAPSIVAALTALRNALGAEGGNRLRIGMGAPAP
jgi:hypothetical protein